MSVSYEGDLQCRARHEPSGATIATDAPVDNHGRGEAFSPTDLVGAALGTCMATIMGLKARQFGLDLKGLRIEVEKEMTRESPRRIARLTCHLYLPKAYSPEIFQQLKRAAEGCPVAHSLHPGIAVSLLWHTASH